MILPRRYPVGGYYKTHSDSHSPGAGVQDRDTERYLSFVLYLNADRWLPEHGGSLKMYVRWTSSSSPGSQGVMIVLST
jgi:Rps23 Pro-64 3,4-dihydroxylase Tpa1-like proline 4-hydroxylase